MPCVCRLSSNIAFFPSVSKESSMVELKWSSKVLNMPTKASHEVMSCVSRGKKHLPTEPLDFLLQHPLDRALNQETSDYPKI